MRFAKRLLRTVLSLAALVLTFSSLASAASTTPDLRLSPEWREALSPMRRMPVQDTGFVRTMYTFSENYISAISGKKAVGKADAFEAVASLLRDPEKAGSVSLIKLSHPELVQVFGSPRISADQWRDEKYRPALIELLHKDQEKWLKPLNSIEYRAGLLEDVDSEFAIIPREGSWLTPLEAMQAGNLNEVDRKILSQWGSLHNALLADDVAAGGEAARELAETVEAAAEQRGVDIAALDLDMFYNTHKPFRNAAVLYLLSALIYGAGLMLTRPRLNWVAFGLLAVGLVENSIGIATRWMLSGRAPLSNMYESFTFAVGGMVLLALILEGMRITRLVGLAGAVLGFIFMVVAHNAPIFDSQIRPLMPALQSSWLTYHVVTIMLSYSAFALSFGVAIVYLLKHWILGGDAAGGFAAKLPSLRALDVFNYRIIAVGFPLLTLGIIFGAVWAATAWGRPWGFDPKETWSAITWLVYAIYLHVRFLAGWTGKRAAILCVIGFLCVLFTYLGVNYLLPGLHSYA